MKDSGVFSSAKPVELKADPCFSFFDKATAKGLTNSAMTVTSACSSQGPSCASCGRFDPWAEGKHICAHCKKASL